VKKATIVGLAIAFVALSGAALFHSSSTPPHHKVTLRWHPPPPVKGVSVVGYNVYRGSKSGGPYTKIASGVHDPIYRDQDVNSKTVYFYVVTAVGGSGKESGFSNEVAANVP
jgi:fibronectin type 3 domain-containing protein